MKTLQQAKDDLEAHFKHQEMVDPDAYKGIAMFTVFVRRDNGQSVITESIGDPGLVKALLRELSDQVQVGGLLVPEPKIILPHAQ